MREVIQFARYDPQRTQSIEDLRQTVLCAQIEAVMEERALNGDSYTAVYVQMRDAPYITRESFNAIMMKWLGDDDEETNPGERSEGFTRESQASER